MGKKAYSIEDLVEEVENELQEEEEASGSEVSPVTPLFPSTKKEAPILGDGLEVGGDTSTGLSVRKEAIISLLSQKLFDLVLVSKDFEALVQAALNEFTECFQAKYSCVLEFDPKWEDFFFRAIVGPEQERLREMRISKNEGLLKRFTSEKKAILLKDFENCKPHNITPLVMAYIHPSTMMGIPLYVGNTFYGVLELINNKEERAFTEEELEALKICSKMLSKVLEVRFFSRELFKRATYGEKK